jgi:uncharacterized cupredoxin-like copper-binding protein
VIGIVGTLVLVGAACGGDGSSDASSTGSSADEGGSMARTVDIKMVDLAFEPKALTVHSGQTVRFMFTNDGESTHDAFIGDAEAQAAHEDEMHSPESEGEASDAQDMGSDEATTEHMSNDEMGSDEGITVEPGKTGELTHTFNQPGTVEIGCHEPGHYDAGMKIKITVS